MAENNQSSYYFTLIERYIDGKLTQNETTAFETAAQADNDLREATYTSRAIRFWQQKMSQKQMEAYSEIVKTNSEQAAIHRYYQLMFTAATHLPTPSDAAKAHLQGLKKQAQTRQTMAKIAKYTITTLLVAGLIVAGITLFYSPNSTENTINTKENDTSIKSPIDTPVIPTKEQNTTGTQNEGNQKTIPNPPHKPINAQPSAPIAYQKAVQEYERIYQALEKILQDSLSLVNSLDNLNEQNAKCVNGMISTSSKSQKNNYSYRSNAAFSKNPALKTLPYTEGIKQLKIHENILEARITEAEKEIVRLEYFCKRTKKDINDCIESKK